MEQCDKTIKSHPIFWLWNISKLETCELKLVLPNAKICKMEFEKLLRSSVVIEKARNQNFNKLSLSIKIPEF